MKRIFQKSASALRRLRRLKRAALEYSFNHLVSHLPGYGLRAWYLRRCLGYRIGPKTAIHMGCFFTGSRICIGEGTVINRNCYLDGRGGLEIGNSGSLSPQTYVVTVTHDVEDEKFSSVMKPVTIGDFVWIGARAMILPGVSIGEGSVLGAGSVATKSIPDGCIFAGNPAALVRERKLKPAYSLRYFPWFDTDLG